MKHKCESTEKNLEPEHKNIDRCFAQQYETVMQQARENPGTLHPPVNYRRMIDGVIHHIGGNNGGY